MPEATPREPHTRKFASHDPWTGDIGAIYVAVGKDGVVKVQEDVIEMLFRRLGFEEVPRD